MEVWAVKYCKAFALVAAGVFLVVMADHMIFSGSALKTGMELMEVPLSRGPVIMTQNQPLARVSAADARRLRNEDPGSFLGNGQISMLFANLSRPEAQGLFHGKMTSRSFKCSTIKRFGNPADGGYDTCLDEPLAPVKNKCLVYSFGIRNDWSFDDAINNQLGCEVHSFDPSIHLEDHLHKPNMYFHNLGIWGSTLVNKEGWKLAGLSEIVKQLKHQNRTIDYVKLDVEGAEFPALREMIDSGVINQVKQLAIEVHTPRLRAAKEVMSVLDYAEIYQSFDDLERVGFRKFLHHANNGCCGRFAELTSKSIGGKLLCCYETLYVNTNFASGTHATA